MVNPAHTPAPSSTAAPAQPPPPAAIAPSRRAPRWPALALATLPLLTLALPPAAPADRATPASHSTAAPRGGGPTDARPGAAASAPRASPAPSGVGDRLFPGLGNRGYDVQSYDLSLDYGGDNSRALRSRTVITAKVTAGRLTRFILDFSGGDVTSVQVNGRRARHRGAGEKLEIHPARPVARHQRLRVTVRHTSEPGATRSGWVRTRDGLALANQPDAAHRVFPCNDHPSDKARFTYRVTAPSELTVVAGGVPAGKRPAGGRTTWLYHAAHPTATELAQLSIGRSSVLRGRSERGLPLRHAVPQGSAAQLTPWLERTPQHLEWMERRVGEYPFATYGLLVAEARTGYQLESQTLPLFERRFLLSARHPRWYRESTLVHELAHQWFGNSVTPGRWSDLWLSEGHATWYEWLYAEGHGGPTLRERAADAYRESDAWRARNGPPAKPRAARGGGEPDIFSPVVYEGSALLLYALRKRIGAGAFERLQRQWVSAHRHGNASTADFTALASEVSGRDQAAFLRPWLHGQRTPPMPGHPRWRSG